MTKQVESTNKEMDERVLSGLANVFFRADNTDLNGAVVQLFADASKELTKARAASVLQTVPKALISHLVDKLEPRSLRDRIQSRFGFWSDANKAYFKNSETR